MIQNATLAFDRERLIPLDEDALACVTAGEGPLSWFLKKAGTVLFDCLSGSLDNLISAAKEGYEDGR